MLWKDMGIGLDAFSSRVLKASLWKVVDTDCVFTVLKKEILFFFLFLKSELQDHCMLVSLALLI